MSNRIGTPLRFPLVANGMGFGMKGLGGLRGLGDSGGYATDANGNIIYDANGNPVASTDYSGIGQALVAGLAVLNSQQVFQLNLQRAQQGLPPVTLPGTTSLVNTSTNTLMLVGAGLVALLLLLRR
ncbi:MAG: hypothetical protein ACYDAK_12900 [Candidatus Limnocylindrales bacterium]